MSKFAPRARVPTLDVNVERDSTLGTAKSPVTPIVSALHKPSLKAQFSLRQAWEKAEQQFRVDSGGKSLTQDIDGKGSVLDKWKESYVPENAEDERRSKQMSSILNNVLNGIELVGAFAAQAAAIVFPPSDMCFNAILFLIDAPRQIQKVYDGLKELFEEIEAFLVKFKIFQRIDDKYGLDEDLIENTNTLLISFVKICGLATKLLHGGKWTSFKTAFKVVLFKDDSGVPAELDNFRRFAERHSMLTGTVTLEHVLQSEQDVKQILGDTNWLKSGVNTLIAASNDEKTKFVNKDRLNTIQSKLFKREVTDEELDFSVASENLLPGTLAALTSTKAYNAWESETNFSKPLLVLWGSAGSGKSSMIDAIKEHLDRIRLTAERDDSSTYVAAYSFGDKRSRAMKSGSNIPYALKMIALQVARQSTMYTKELFLQLQKQEKVHTEEDVEKIWSLLRLSKFKVPRSSVLYIILDAVNRARDSEFDMLLKLLVESGKSTSLDSPKIRVLLSTDVNPQNIEARSNASLLAISANEINKTLIVPFVNHQMQQLSILQDVDRVTRKLKQSISQRLTDGSEDVNFNTVRQKLIRLQEAIERGLPSSAIASVLEDTNNTQSEAEGKAILTELEESLSSHDVKLLNSILMWLLGSQWGSMEVATLQAALHLEGANLPIEPLMKRIQRRFAGILTWVDESIVVDMQVRTYLRENQYRPDTDRADESKSLITFDLSVKNASVTTVKQFVWDLNERMMNGKFDFELAQPKVQSIRFDVVQAQLTITRLLFQLMNEGWNIDTEGLLWYALREFPAHLAELREDEDRITKADRKMIGEGLVAFLNDPYMFELRHESYGDGRWMTDSDSVSAVQFWLEDVETVRQLPLKDQRWLKRVMDPQNGPLGFMRDQALGIATRWLTDYRTGPYELWSWLDNYLVAVERMQDEAKESNEETDVDNYASSDGQPEIQQPKPVNDAVAGQLEDSHKTDFVVHDTDGHDQLSANGLDGDKTGFDEETIVNTAADGAHHGCEQLDKVKSQNSTALASADAVARAQSWALQHANVQKTAVYHLNLGVTYIGLREITRALEHYRLAVEDANVRHHALHGIAQCLRLRCETTDAIKHAMESLGMYESMRASRELDDYNRGQYIETLRYWSEFLEEQQMYAVALKLSERLCDLEPDNALTSWIVLRLRCVLDESQTDVLQLFDEWSANDSSFGGQSAALSMLELIEQDDFETHVLPMIRHVKNENLRDRMLKVAIEATATTSSDSVQCIHSRLAYLQGIAFALHPDPATQRAAIEHWQRVLATLPRNVEIRWTVSRLISKTITVITKWKFDQLHAMIRSKPNATASELQAMYHELQDILERTTKAAGIEYDAVTGVTGGEAYLVGFCSLAGLQDEVRQLCRQEISEALEILSDSDPYNDSAGGKLLARIFTCLGDKAGALTAFSLLDRNIVRKRLTSTNGNVSNGLDPNDVVDVGFFHYCDNCQRDVYSSNSDGTWWCRFCPDFDLCSACKTLHDQGRLRLETCSSTHAPYYTHIVHHGYTIEDLEVDKVRVDWEHVPDGEGRFTRKGGRIIDQSEWVRLLRKTWDIPEIQGSTSRAQQ